MKTIALLLLSSLACIGQLGDPAFVAALTQPATALAFSPTNISGMSLWFKADALTYSDGNNILGFADLSGAGHHFTNLVGGATYPVFHTGGVNSLPYAEFTPASSQRLRIVGNTTVSIGTAQSLFVVLAPGTVSANNAFIADLASNWMWINSSANPNFWVTGHNALSTATLSLNAWVFLEVVRNGTAVSWWVSGSAAGTPTLSVNDAWGYQYIGADAGGNYFSGKITEILIYDSALSPTDRGNVETYLHTRTGL